MVTSYHLRYLSLLTNFSSPHLSFHYIVHRESWISLAFLPLHMPHHDNKFEQVQDIVALEEQDPTRCTNDLDANEVVKFVGG